MKIRYEELYGAQAQEQLARYEEIQKGFEETFGDAANGEWFSAPGRTEIGGNHTDHNHGHVITAAVNLDIVGLARKTDNNTIRLKSGEYPNIDIIDLNDLAARPEHGGSQEIIRGICAKCRELGYTVGGFDCYTLSRVMKGSGLSSSAAFEILVVTVISHLYNDDRIDPVTAAVIAQYAENVYFGKPSGLLDQMASSVGGFTSIDFKEPTKPVIRQVDFDFNSCGHVLCVVDTGGNHSDLTPEYAAIPAEMKSVAAYFGKTVLREVDEREFYAHIKELRAAVGDRAVLRAMHFFDDDRLAVKEADALEHGDFAAFKAMIHQSGQSSYQRLQNVFAVVNPAEQGVSLALAVSAQILGEDGAYRVHGGGFAGTIQAFVQAEKLSEYREAMENIFGEGVCHVLSVRAAGGTKVLR